VIWIGLVAVVVAVGGSWIVANTLRSRAVVLAAAAVGILCYVFIGQPAKPDQPLSARLEELDKRSRTGAETMTPDQLMALLQKRALDDPADPNAHKFMGDLLESVGRVDEAVMAYQSALRRDPEFQPALKDLADLLFKRSGAVDAYTTELYRAAYRQAPDDARIGFMAALGDYQAGKVAEAEAEWARIEAPLAAEDPRRQMFQAFRNVYVTGEAEAAEPADAAARLP